MKIRPILKNGALCLAFSITLFGVGQAGRSPYDWALIQLDYSRKEKVEQLRRFGNRIQALAANAAADPTVVNFFDINRQYASALKEGSPPEALTAKVQELRQEFNRYYIENYFAFYDILFIDPRGFVFYTIRKEADWNHLLLEGPLARGALAECIRRNPTEEVFIDFHDYGPSSEPAAFFVQPILQNGTPIGWLALQCAIGKVNSLFVSTQDLGQTGEMFLVNEEGFLLTESYFEGVSTILKKKLDDRNIQAKFQEKVGHRTVTDYRGATALTSFEVFEFKGVRWLIVAKIDQDEVTTGHYGRHRRYYAERLLAALNPTPPRAMQPVTPEPDRTILRIDMDEFLIARNGEILETFGISTCTGLLMALPGRFAYLAHVSPKDKVYGSEDTDLLGQMTKKATSFDIYPFEKHRLRFWVVANHLESLPGIIDSLVGEGFLLSQIRFLYNPQSSRATVTYDYREDALQITWKMPDSSEGAIWGHRMEDSINVGMVIQTIVQAEEKKLDMRVLE